MYWVWPEPPSHCSSSVERHRSVNILRRQRKRDGQQVGGEGWLRDKTWNVSQACGESVDDRTSRWQLSRGGYIGCPSSVHNIVVIRKNMLNLQRSQNGVMEQVSSTDSPRRLWRRLVDVSGLMTQSYTYVGLIPSFPVFCERDAHSPFMKGIYHKPSLCVSVDWTICWMT